MVTDRREDSGKTPGKQGVEQRAPEANEINASTFYDFNGKNLTPYGGLLPVITMLGSSASSLWLRRHLHRSGFPVP